MSVDPGGNPQQFKCPSCGSNGLVWNASLGAMHCPYCNHKMPPPPAPAAPAAGPPHAPQGAPGMPNPTMGGGPGAGFPPQTNAGPPMPGAGPAFPGMPGAGAPFPGAQPGAGAPFPGSPSGPGPREIPLREGLTRAPKGLGVAVRTVACRDCGATVNLGPTDQTVQCTYCASNMVMPVETDPNLITPESLVPFLVPREKASEQFKTWLAGLWFRPSDLKRMAQLEQIVGVYVPFWTFDAHVSSQWTAERGHYYYVTETYTEVENGQTVVKTREVQHTRWEPASGYRNDNFDDVLVCGSKGLPEALVDKFSTFDTTKLTHYQPQFLAGWRAESYAIDLPNAWPLAQRKIERQQTSRCSGDVGGDTQRSLNVHNTYANETFKHVLLPVYVAAYRYQNKPFRFLVNGQTGEVVGESPLSWVKITLLVLFIAAVVTVIVLIARSSESASMMLTPAIEPALRSLRA